MRLYCEGKDYKLYEGSMLDMLDEIPLNSIDAVVTDPPYEIGFMGKGWDKSGIAFQKETWEKCYKVLKPGGYLLSFGGCRTFHRIACAIEDAGFEIRDNICWIFGSGFPKSQNLGKSIEAKLTMGTANTQAFNQLDGEKADKGDWGYARFQYDQGARPSNYDENGNLRTTKVDYHTSLGEKYDGCGTALKPAHEDILIAQKPLVADKELRPNLDRIIVARKPCEGSTTDNVIKYGVGGINIDECRIGVEERTYKGMSSHKPEGAGTFRDDNWQPKDIEVTVDGRFPANLILSYNDENKDEVIGGFPDCHKAGNKTISNRHDYDTATYKIPKKDVKENPDFYGDEGSAARYFYNAEESNRDDGIPNRPKVKYTHRKPKDGSVFNTDSCGFDNTKNTIASANPDGRFPANLILTYDDEDYDEVCGGFPVGGQNGSITKRYEMNNRVYGDYGSCNTWDAYEDSGSASRYFYCAKASTRDRDEGLDGFEIKTKVFNGQSDVSSKDMKDVEQRFTTKMRNTHATVKPTSLMQYLVRLVCPNGSTILDPFNGSGSTGKAVMYENKDRDKGYKYIGIDLSDEYLEISKARIDYAANDNSTVIYANTRKEEPKKADEQKYDIWDDLI